MKKNVAILIKQMVEELCRDISNLCRDKNKLRHHMNSIATKYNSVVIENSITMRQIKKKLSRQRISMLRQTFQRMSILRQILCHGRRKLCCDTTFRARNGR